MSEYDRIHANRYNKSTKWIGLCVFSGARVLELGGETGFTRRLRENFSSAEHSCKNFDLRRPFPIKSNSFDLVVCMEVIEHLTDIPSEDPIIAGTYRVSGVMNMLSESLRVLVPGGKLFLTTPNICGYKNLDNILSGSHPFGFQPHQRELSMVEVAEYVTKAGFSISEIQTVEVWNHHSLAINKLKKVKEMLGTFGYEKRNRDDCIFVIASKQ
jgi:2-polyprenyl-3-methyl-5-hydroxy-6-metoxy-1,4-benzoquinol methylase